MKKYSYYREQLDILTQFVAAFDDCFVYRYTKDFESKEKINVRYVMGGKQRVLYDIVNQAKNLSLPVVAIEQKSLIRDSSRIQFKDNYITRKNLGNDLIAKIPVPVPVKMDVNISIIANYKEDIDQIVQNFIPWCNPYFIISWKVPEEFGMDYIDELRTEVTWSGNINYELPSNLQANDKYRISADTSFTLKGWIFPSVETPQEPIYVVNNNFYSVATSTNLTPYDSYPALSGEASLDVINISAYPQFTNVFYKGIPIYTSESISLSTDHTYTFYGKRFGFNNSWYLSGQKVANLPFEEINTARYPKISGYKLSDVSITTVNDNITVISLSGNYLSAGKFTFVTANSAGWSKINYDILVI